MPAYDFSTDANTDALTLDNLTRSQACKVFEIVGVNQSIGKVFGNEETRDGVLVGGRRIGQ